MTPVALALIALSSAFLFVYGVNLLFLSWLAARLEPPPPPRTVDAGEPAVAVQLPIYNEQYVAARVIDAAARLDWPADRLEIQVLDDSDDETTAIVAERAAHWLERGIRVQHVRRGSRLGYKAGALAHGLTLSPAPFLAVFDADSVPGPDFLRRTVGGFDDPRCGFVQARWSHLNEPYSWFTRLQALMIDFHFLVEQAVRPARGYLTNFTGTAGIWRRAAIESAGGWRAETLTEDLDLSYRAQLAGWGACYVEEVAVAQELPVSVGGYRRQQARWATGSFQTAYLLLGTVFKSSISWAARFQAALHLLAYLAPVLMLVQVSSFVVLLFDLDAADSDYAFLRIPVIVSILSLAPVVGFAVAQARRGRVWWRSLPGILGWSFVGAGTSLTVFLALIRSLRSGGEFQRTPKFRIEERGQEWRDGAYVSALDPIAPLELLFGLLAFALASLAAARGWWLVVIYSGLFGGGFFFLGGLSLAQSLQVLTLRRLGRGALARLRLAIPLLVVLTPPAALLLALAQLPTPFEDSYHHWLIAANLAQTGRLRDPLFGMEDTWLPGYHLVAALVLKVFGVWQLGLLRFLNVSVALATLALVYRIAGSPSRGRLAVLLTALNPVFVLTATSVVAEPLLTLALTGATAAALARRLRIAATLAALACLTGTKAWLWLLAVAGVLLLGAARQTGLRPLLRWLAPALALLAVLQVTLGAATNSVARAAQEVTSAAGRGSLAADPGLRVEELLFYFGLASLPLVGLALFGLRREIADPAGRRRLTLVYLPAFVYLGAIAVLVFGGAYSGSHRYLYPALPALGLLAAAALDRRAAPAALLTATASALLLIAYLPVLVGFGHLNQGLTAAGRSLAGVPGTLLTDSPVVAYASGHSPSDIVGSRDLPAGRAAAVTWMEKRGVTAIAVEDIDYYRAAQVLPDLTAGSGGAPFLPLAGRDDFQVPGGKPVHTYLLVTSRPAPAGKTAHLAHGLSVAGLAGEGVGFGVPLAQYPDGAVFAGSVSWSGSWRAVYNLDTMVGDARHQYRFEKVPTRGRVTVDYSLAGNRVKVVVSAVDLAPGFGHVVLLNEQSSRFDDLAATSVTSNGDRIGIWSPVDGSWARFRSAAYGLEWSLAALPDAQLLAGREFQPPVLDWSGLEYSFGPGFAGESYEITIQGAR